MYLGIDLGTSAVKTILVDHEQRVVASRSQSLTGGFSTSRLFRNKTQGSGLMLRLQRWTPLKAAHPRELAAVDGIGLSGQMHGATLLDANFKPLRPCILWNDGRSAAECRMLEQRWPRIACDDRQQGPCPDSPLPKLVWVAKHEPEIFAATKLVFAPESISTA